jgi:hypothetical protein
MLGRVRALELLAAYALTPLAYVVVGQLSEEAGARQVMAACGLAGVALTVVAYRLPGMRETEGRVRLSPV